MTASNVIRVKGRNGKWLQTFVSWEGEWHVNPPIPARAPDVLPGGFATETTDRLIEAGATMALDAIDDVMRDGPARGTRGLIGVGDFVDDLARRDRVSRNRRRLNSYPDVNGLLPLIPGNPISPEKLTPILDRLLAVGMHVIDVDQLREIVTARR